MTEVDSAIEKKNSDTLRLLYKVYAELFQRLLPHIRDKKIHAVIVKTIKRCKQQRRASVNGCIHLTSINRMSMQLSKAWNNGLKERACDCDDN